MAEIMTPNTNFEELFGVTGDDIEEITNMFIDKGATFKDLHGLSKKDLEVIYSLAHSMYTTEKYEDSEKVFLFLCFNDHLDKRFWMGLAATQQMLKKYEEAVQNYTMAAFLDIEDPMIPMNSAWCMLALGRLEEAKGAFEAVIELSADKNEFNELKIRAESLLAIVSQKIEGRKADE